MQQHKEESVSTCPRKCSRSRGRERSRAVCTRLLRLLEKQGSSSTNAFNLVTALAPLKKKVKTRVKGTNTLSTKSIVVDHLVYNTLYTHDDTAVNDGAIVIATASKVVCNSMHSSACDHRVCCNIIHCPCLRILQSRAHPAPCTQEHVSVHVCEQSQQIQEKGGRPATESACKCRSSSSQKQQLKAQIIYLIHLFFPSFKRKIY